MNDTILILAGTAFLASVAFAAFTVVVVSIRRNERARLSETKGQRAGTIARRVLAGISTGSEEDNK